MGRDCQEWREWGRDRCTDRRRRSRRRRGPAPGSDRRAGGGMAALVGRLAGEFSAPGRACSTRATGAWLRRRGAPAEAFPRLGPGLDRRRLGPRQGRRLARRRGRARPSGCSSRSPRRPGRSWRRRVRLAAAPTRPRPPPSAGGPSAPSRRSGPGGSRSPTSSAPTPGRRRPRPRRSTIAPARSRPQPDGAERLLVARLVRRLRISDPPERFQQMATNALRTALGVQAVAWVPCHHSEPVVVNGDVGRLKGDGYRTLIPGPHHKDADARRQRARASPVDPELRRTRRRLGRLAGRRRLADRPEPARRPARSPPPTPSCSSRSPR